MAVTSRTIRDSMPASTLRALSMIFTATAVPSVMEWAWYTLAKLPRPRRRPSLYLPRITPAGVGSMKAGGGKAGGCRNPNGGSAAQARSEWSVLVCLAFNFYRRDGLSCVCLAVAFPSCGGLVFFFIFQHCPLPLVLLSFAKEKTTIHAETKKKTPFSIIKNKKIIFLDNIF